MRKIKKVKCFLAVFLALSVWFSQGNMSEAAEAGNAAAYDLTVGGTQSFEVEGPDGTLRDVEGEGKLSPIHQENERIPVLQQS